MDRQISLEEEIAKVIRERCKGPWLGENCVYLSVCPDWFKERVNCEGKEGKEDAGKV